MRNLAQDLEGFAQVRVTSPPFPETNIAVEIVEKSGFNQLRLVVYPFIYKGFYYS